MQPEYLWALLLIVLILSRRDVLDDAWTSALRQRRPREADQSDGGTALVPSHD